MVNLKCNLGSEEFQTPIFTASGTFGYGNDFPNIINEKNIGAIITKSITYRPRIGNPPPRISETSSGMLNSIGLANIGLKKFINEVIPQYDSINTKIIVNIAGSVESEYIKVLDELDTIKDYIIGYEVNISCPNVEHGGMELGVSAKLSNRLISQLRKHTNKLLIVKLTPNVTDITDIAKAVEDAGADAISAINTLVGMRIDINTRKPLIHKTYGGLSGPAIKPIALAMVHKIYQKIKIPIIGVGGITSSDDVVEFFLAGATAVQVGTANFRNPTIYHTIIKDLKQYCKNNKIEHYQQLIGNLDLYE